MTPQNNPDPFQKKYIIAIPLLFLLAVCFYAVAALITGGPVEPENAAAATKIVCAEPPGTPTEPHVETTPAGRGGGQRGDRPSGGIPVEFQPGDTSPLEILPEEKPPMKNPPTEIQGDVEPFVEILPLESNSAAIVRNRFVRPLRFLTDVCVTHDGTLWVTAEAGGVFRLGDPETDREWEDMRAQPGFPATSNCTAVCEDSLGRIWVGTASMGVQVFAGGKWRRYDRDSVLGGSHVHDLASSESGLVAVAHEQGVSIYDSKRDSWRDYTVLDGLPSGGVRGVCFGAEDRLHCATESGGYARIDVRDLAGVRTVSHLTAPETWGAERAVLFPLTESGKGLSSNFCNGITLDDTGRICIAGLNGISYGKDRDFQFLQGRDLKAKMDGVYWKGLIAKETEVFQGTDAALKESYVNCVLHGKYGLWIGYRTQGVEQRASGDPGIIRDYSFPRITCPVRTFVELPDGRVFAATYGAGLVKLIKFDPVDAPPAVVQQTADAAHPSYRTVNPVSILRDIRQFARVQEDRPESEAWAQYLGEDWVTKGDWAGRYGARKQVLCAMNAPSTTRPWSGGVSNAPIQVGVGSGPQGSGSRSWVDWERADDNRDVLLQMEYGHRTQAEWNDNGQEYSRTFDGPDLWLTIIPDKSAIWRFSLYFFNSNGRNGNNVERDYIIEIYESSQSEKMEDWKTRGPLCTARVADFASGGVYKTFLLRNSPQPNRCFHVRLIRNGSLNAILNGVFFDRLFEAQDVRRIPESERIAEQGTYRAPRWYDCGCDELEGVAGLFLDQYFDAGSSTRGVGTMPQLRLVFYRYIRTRLPSKRNLAERLRWDAAIWTDADRAEFDAAMKKYAEERRAAGASK